MAWILAMLLAQLSGGDGGTAPELTPAFHEPMTRPVPRTRIDWRYPPELLTRRVSGLIILQCVS